MSTTVGDRKVAVSRSEALKNDLPFYVSNIKCAAGHTGYRDTRTGACISCQQEKARLSKFTKEGDAERAALRKRIEAKQDQIQLNRINREAFYG
jgi:hypothetical protein